MWSASSSTVTSTSSRVQAPWPIRSSSRPGQATTMSTPLRSAADLGALTDTAEDGTGAQAGGRRERRQGGVDLADQLTGRGQDQGPRCARAGVAAVGETGDQRQQEGVGLARAGAAAAEHVTPGEGVGQGRGLDGSGGLDALLGENGGQACRHAEVSEGGQGKRYLCGVSPKPGPKASGGFTTEQGHLLRRGGQLAARARRIDDPSLAGRAQDPGITVEPPSPRLGP